MVEEQQERCAKIAALLTESCPREARFLAQRATARAAAPDNIKRLHAAGYTNVTRGTLSIAPALLMARMKKPECVDQLRLWLECGGSVDAQQRGGGDWQMGGNGGLLCQAIHVRNADAAALLIRRGANTEGALHQLCSLKDFPRAVEIARLLVDAGADVNAVRHGRQRLPWGDMRPLRDAVFNGYDDVVHLLLSRGAKTDWYEQLWRSRSVDGAVLLTNSNKLIAVVLAAGGWRKYTLPPRKDMLVLRELCEKDRAKPSAQCERLFALPKGVFWRVIGFWRSHLDDPHAIDDEEYTAALTKQPTAQEYNYHRVARVMPGMNLDAAGAEAFASTGDADAEELDACLGRLEEHGLRHIPRDAGAGVEAGDRLARLRSLHSDFGGNRAANPYRRGGGIVRAGAGQEGVRTEEREAGASPPPNDGSVDQRRSDDGQER